MPGYRTYDLAKAKQLVKELGGLKTQLGTINVLVAKQTTQALQSQWAQAGIKTEIKSYDLGPLIQAFQSKKWTAMLQTAGSYDPAAGVGVAFRYRLAVAVQRRERPEARRSARPGSGHPRPRPAQDALRPGRQVHERQGLRPFLFAFAPANVAAKGVTGPGLTTALTCVVVNAEHHLRRGLDGRWRRGVTDPGRTAGAGARLLRSPALRLIGKRLRRRSPSCGA